MEHNLSTTTTATATATLNTTTPRPKPDFGSFISISPASLALKQDDFVQAYAKLEFDSFSFYIQTLSVVLGRVNNKDAPNTVDLHLANTKTISRKHARLFYNFARQRFEVLVVGKNGAFVNDKFVASGGSVPLVHGTRLQIGEIAFTFLLPPQEVILEEEQDMDDDNEDDEDEQLVEEEDYEEDVEQRHLDDDLLASTSRQPHSEAHSSSSGEGSKKQKNKAMIKTMKNKKKQPSPLPNINGKPSPAAATAVKKKPPTPPTRPTLTNQELIIEAFKNSEESTIPLSSIHAYIQQTYPYFKKSHDKMEWKSGIRQTLANDRRFIRHRLDNGKGVVWSYDPDAPDALQRAAEQRDAAAAAAAAAASTAAQAKKKSAGGVGDAASTGDANILTSQALKMFNGPMVVRNGVIVLNPHKKMDLGGIEEFVAGGLHTVLQQNTQGDDEQFTDLRQRMREIGEGSIGALSGAIAKALYSQIQEEEENEKKQDVEMETKQEEEEEGEEGEEKEDTAMPSG